MAGDHAPHNYQKMSTCVCCCRGQNCDGNHQPPSLSVSLHLSRICPNVVSTAYTICRRPTDCCEGAGRDPPNITSACLCSYQGSYPDPNPGSGVPYVAQISLTCYQGGGSVVNCPHNKQAACNWVLAVSLNATAAGAGSGSSVYSYDPLAYHNVDCADLSAACGGDGCVDICAFVLGTALYFTLTDCTDAMAVNHPGWSKGCNPGGKTDPTPGSANADNGNFFLHAPTTSACTGDYAEAGCGGGGCPPPPPPGPCDIICEGCEICRHCIACIGCLTDPTDPVLCPHPADCTECISCEGCLPCYNCLIDNGLLMAARPAIAAAAARMAQAGTTADGPNLLDLLTEMGAFTPRSRGKVGDELAAMLKQMGLGPPAGTPPCPTCADWIDWMNKQGPTGVRRNALVLIAHLEEEAGKVGGWAKLSAAARALWGGLPVTIPGLIDEACRRAEAKDKPDA